MTIIDDFLKASSLPGEQIRLLAFLDRLDELIPGNEDKYPLCKEFLGLVDDLLSQNCTVQNLRNDIKKLERKVATNDGSQDKRIARALTDLLSQIVQDNPSAEQRRTIRAFRIQNQEHQTRALYASSSHLSSSTSPGKS